MVTFEGIALISIPDFATQGRTQQDVLWTEPKIEVLLQANEAEYELLVPKGSTVYDLMRAASEMSNFRFRGRDFGGLGFFVEEVEGLAQDSSQGMYWIYYVNNEKAKVGVSSYIISPNDIISWKYEKAE